MKHTDDDFSTTRKEGNHANSRPQWAGDRVLGILTSGEGHSGQSPVLGATKEPPGDSRLRHVPLPQGHPHKAGPGIQGSLLPRRDLEKQRRRSHREVPQTGEARPWASRGAALEG